MSTRPWDTDPKEEDAQRYDADHAAHFRDVLCIKCKDHTAFGDSCCGMTQCNDECLICKESE